MAAQKSLAWFGAGCGFHIEWRKHFTLLESHHIS
jgi:hypothetical protein